MVNRALRQRITVEDVALMLRREGGAGGGRMAGLIRGRGRRLFKSEKGIGQFWMYIL